MAITAHPRSESVWRRHILNRLQAGGAVDACLAIAIFVVALALRLTWVNEFVSHPLGRIPYVDELGYLIKAEDIYNGSWFPDRPFYQDPLLPYVLATLMKFVGTGIIRLRMALAVMGSLTPVALFYAGRRGLGRSEGVIAGLGAAHYGPLVFADGLVEKEGLAALTAAMALFLTATAINDRRRVLITACAGMSWGALVLLRANAILIAPLGFACWLVSDGVRRPVRSLAFVLGFALPLMPVTAVNAMVSRPHELILTTWQGGANFYIGNGPEAAGRYTTLAFVRGNPLYEAADFAAEAQRRAGRRLSPGEISGFWYREGFHRWKADPIASLSLLLRKLGFVFNNTEIPDSSDAVFVRIAAAPALAWAWISFGVLFPLAVLSFASERRSPFKIFVALVILIGLLSTAAFFVVGRYRVPWAPALILLAAAGVTDLVRLLKNRRWKSFAWRAGLIVMPVTVLAWWPQNAFVPDRWAHGEIYLALAYTEAGQIQAVIDALDDARAIGPGGAAQVDLQLKGDFRHHLARALAGPLATARSLERARLLRQLPPGRTEAKKLIDTALEANPLDPVALRESGAWWLGETGDPRSRQRAEAQLRQAARGQPGDYSAALLLSLLKRDSTPMLSPVAKNAGTDHVRNVLIQKILEKR
jgi:4-amino-4-deoxy-L-arabinose transferase-like glycosyltransferase